MFEQKSLDKIDGDYFNIIIADSRVNCIRLTERIACRTANISVVPRISILRWIRLAITVFVRIPECRSWD